MIRPIRVLHVDDEPEFADLTATFLRREGDRFDIETATSADAGLDRLADDEFDCIVSDYDMPGQNGIEFLESVREEYPAFPFILFTGKGSEEVASEAISAGVTDYLKKGSVTEQYELLANRISNAVTWHRAQANYQELFEKTGVGLVIGDPETGTILDANQAYADMTGYDPEEVAGENFGSLSADDTADTETYAEQLMTQAVEEGPQSFEWLHETGGGEERWMHVTLTPAALNGQQRVLASVEDITERKEHEQELQSQRDRYQSLFENIPLVIWEQDHSEAMEYVNAIASEVADIETYLLEHPKEIDRLTERIEIIDVNQNALDYYDAPSKGVLMDNLDDVMVEQTTEVLAAQWAAFANGETRFRTETAVRTLSGNRRDELLNLFVPEENAEDYARVYVVGTEITEHKERERQLQRQNERLDKFTSAVSHDLRNPLHVASSRLELAADECDNPHLRDVADVHEQMEQLIDDLLAFAQAGSEAIDHRTIDLECLFEECWEALQSDEASLVVEIERPVQADRDRLRQLLKNLLANALEHGGADVSITVGGLDNGFYVEDDGPGIPKTEHEDIFEAGYSTIHDGTGFGLSIIEEVAEVHGWDVQVTEGTEGGARFEITGVEFTA